MNDQSVPFVSVIIPVYNDADKLRLCLKALEKQTYPRECYEVIVVDNGSDVSIEPIVHEYAQAVCTHESQPGSYAARNKGIELARGSVLAFTDADCKPDAEWLTEGVRKLQEVPGCGLIGGRIDIFFADERNPTAIELYDYLWSFPQEQIVVEQGRTVTANLIAFKEAFDKVGGFDSRLKSGGDREWCNRAVAAGHKIAYADKATILHPARRTLEELTQRTRRISGGRADRLKYNSGGSTLQEVRDILWEMRPPFRAVGRIWSEPAIQGSLMKLKVLAVALLVRYLGVSERVRLLLGGVSRR